jgi:hypothetical protein
MKGCFSSREVFRQKRAGEFDGEKLMPIARLALGLERLIAAIIKRRGAGCEVRASAPAFNESVPFQIEAQFHATRMKTRRPIELAFGQEIVPLDAVTHAAKAAEKRLPARADVAPGRAFAEDSFLSGVSFDRRTGLF